MYTNPAIASLPVTGGMYAATGSPWVLYTAVSFMIGAAALRVIFRRQALRP